MNASVGIWIAWAVLLFWAVGAYNRLVRLRAQARVGFAALEQQLAQYVTLVQGSMAGGAEAAQADAQAGLLGAAKQFESALNATRAHPLDAMALRALATAHEALRESWLRWREAPPDLAGEPLPAALQQQWTQIATHADNARREFNLQVQVYNDAIVQFPARLLAWLFGFKPAHEI